MAAWGAAAAVAAGAAGAAGAVGAVAGGGAGADGLPAEAPSADPSKPEDARPALGLLGERVRPITLAGDRRIPVSGVLAAILPQGGLRRGSVISVEGEPGAGATSLALHLMAAVTATGEWVAVCHEPRLLAPSVLEAGVAPERLVVVRDVPRSRRVDVLAALVEGMSLVAIGGSAGVRPAQARRLAARARERGTIVVALGPWADRAEVRIRADRGSWRCEGGRLTERALQVEVGHRGREYRRSLVA